jgi:TDG/mug DNA glycosylase family protein
MSEQDMLAKKIGTTKKAARIPRGRILGSPRAGQLDLELRKVEGLALPDKIPATLHTLFVGVNPGIRSAIVGHYFAGHTNYFWKLMAASGIWPTPLTTFDDDKMVDQGFGFTDTCKRPTPGIHGLTRSDFVECKTRIRRLVKSCMPRTVVFVSKSAYRIFLGDLQSEVRYGLQTQTLEGVPIFVVPSTSGRSLADSSYRTKVRWFQKLKVHLSYWPVEV